MRPVNLRSRRARSSISSRRAQLIARAAALLALGTLWIGVPGCMENIALIGRPTIEEGQDDVVGEVEHVDVPARRLYLRSNKSNRRVVALSADAQVFHRGREYPVARLKLGDIVAMQIKRDSRGEPYADLLRVQDNSAGQNMRDVPSSAPRIETLAGRVESVIGATIRLSSMIAPARRSWCAFQNMFATLIGNVFELCAPALALGSKATSPRAIDLKC